jgi:hypothetical protein
MELTSSRWTLESAEFMELTIKVLVIMVLAKMELNWPLLTIKL